MSGVSSTFIASISLCSPTLLTSSTLLFLCSFRHPRKYISPWGFTFHPPIFLIVPFCPLPPCSELAESNAAYIPYALVMLGGPRPNPCCLCTSSFLILLLSYSCCADFGFQVAPDSSSISGLSPARSFKETSPT